MLPKKYLASCAILLALFGARLRTIAQVHLSRGMCNFDPCVKVPVAARCEVDVSYVGVASCVCPDGMSHSACAWVKYRSTQVTSGMGNQFQMAELDAKMRMNV